MHCIACGEQNPPSIGIARGDGVELVRCTACGLCQAAETPLDVAELYGAHYFQKVSPESGGSTIGYSAYEAMPWIHTLWQAAFVRSVMGPAPGLRILDIGCATGRFLECAGTCGWEAVGVDISEQAVALARGKGLTAFSGELCDLGWPDAGFDAIVCWDVLEHLVSFDAFLQECRRLLRPSGLLFFSTPDCGSEQAIRDGADWIGYRSSYEHTAYFTLASIRRLLVRRLGGHVRVSRRARDPYAFLLGYWSPDRGMDEEALPGPRATEQDRLVLDLSFDAVSGRDDEEAPRDDPADLVTVWQALAVGDWPLAFRVLAEMPSAPYASMLWLGLEAALESSAVPASASAEAVGARLHQMSLIVKEVLVRGRQAVALPHREEQGAVPEEAARLGPNQPESGAVAAALPIRAETEPGAAGLAELRSELANLGSALWAAQRDLESSAEACLRGEEEREGLALTIADWKTRAEALRAELDRIHQSRSWRTLARFWAWRRRVRRWSQRRQGVSATGGGAQVGYLSPGGGGTPKPRVVPVRGRPAYDVFVFGVINWGFRFQRPQQLARALSRAGHRIFYVAAEFTTGEQPEVRELAPGVKEILFSSRGRTMSPYTSVIDDGMQQVLLAQVCALRSRWGIGSAVSIVDLPFWSPVALGLRAAFGWRTIYDCMDRHDGFSSNGEQMLQLEGKLQAEADAVVVSSAPLLADVEPRREGPTVLIRNAADVEHFSSAFEDIPSAQGAPVVVGYYGAIAEWFDVAAVADIARAHADWELLLIGDVTHPSAKATLARYSNVRFTGELPYVALPERLRRFSVAIIPFLVLPLTEATNPVKVYEYLASGRPCVSTNLPEVSALAAEYPGTVELVAPGESWAEAVERALTEDSVERRRRRAMAAAANDWVDRGEALRRLVRAIHPSVSILIVSFNNKQYTSECLRSVDSWAWSYPGHLEVIVVDNASQDGTAALVQEWATQHPGARAILNAENRGFAPANNQALHHAHGDIVLFLNNDAYLTPGSVERLVSHLDDPEIGLVGPVTNEIGNEAKIEVPYERLEDMVPFALSHSANKVGEVFDIAVCALFCAAMRRDVLTALGGLDERFEVGMFEDDDLAMAVRRRGLRVVCAEDVFVHHVGRAAFGGLPEAEYQEILMQNRRRWEEKWRVPWTPHRYRATPGVDGG